MEKEQNELNNINDDYCYYNCDTDYLIFPNDKEKRKKIMIIIVLIIIMLIMIMIIIIIILKKKGFLRDLIIIMKIINIFEENQDMILYKKTKRN
jgi:predicted nucleic acid-binding Zn ribbon protein